MLRGLWKKREGSAAIEFALLAPVFFYLVFAVIEIFAFMLTQSILESAVRNSARSGLTGYTPSGLDRATYISQQVENEVFFVDPDNIQMETLIYSNFADINQPEPFVDENTDGFYDVGEPYTDINGNGAWDSDMGLAGLGGAGDIVVYRVSYLWNFMTPLIGDMMSPSGSIEISSSAVVRNEPF